MAKRRPSPSPSGRSKAGTSAGSGKSGASTLRLHDPSKTPNTVTVDANTVLDRIHRDCYEPTQFNDNDKGNARFSPIRNAAGEIIPTIYAADSFSGAAMETAFHDVPVAGNPKVVQHKELEDLVHSQVVVKKSLVVADLTRMGLHQLGLEKSQVIETSKRQYPETRAFAEDLHRHHPKLQGLTWVSRQDDTARSYVFFGDRIPKGGLSPSGKSNSLLDDAATKVKLQETAKRIGATLVSKVTK